MAPLAMGVCTLGCLGARKTNALAVYPSWEAPKVQGASDGKGAGLRLLRVQTLCMYGNGGDRTGDDQIL